jgi:hypothetical protein
MPTTEMPHNGEMLKAHFAEKRIRKAALARLMHIQPSQLLQYTKRANLPAQVLWDISQHLQYNFLAEIALQLPSSLAQPPQEKNIELNNAIQTLKAEINRLQVENNLMKAILKDKNV